MRKLAKIAVSAAIFAIDKPYSYVIPSSIEDKVLPGVRVFVPFGRGNKRCEGLVLAICDETDRSELKSIESVLDKDPVLTIPQIQLALWIRERFFCTLFEAVRAMLPAGMWFKDGEKKIGDKTQKFASLIASGEEAVAIAQQKRLKAPQQAVVLMLLASVGEAAVSDIANFTGAPISSIKALEKQGLIETSQREVYRIPTGIHAGQPENIELSDEQTGVFNGLNDILKTKKAAAALLYGVTGSGKTMIYIRLVQETINNGSNAIVLVPEIGLTPQFIDIFSTFFGESVAVLHSSLTMGERYDEWKRIKAGLVRVVIGTRSAIFAPFDKVGLIIIDEEQEHTYKSENSPRYHARDIAKYICVKNDALLVLGSATPSIESMYYSKEGRYSFFELNSRFNERPLPEVNIVDMREELKSGNGGIISLKLKSEIEKNMAAGEQSILFINRRGASSLVVCGECGYTYSCPNCSVSMTYHSVGRRLLCHYCGHTRPLPDLCPECGGKLKFIGVGTQKAEEELRNLFPDIDIMRMDTDTVSKAGSHERLLTKFSTENVPILIGTQMVTKGLDFENVTLVGVLSADQLLYVNDFRANEKAFSLITQVVGRAGRGKKNGRAIIQTYTPKNEVLKLAAKQAYFDFYDREIGIRQITMLPPIRDMFALTVSGINEAAVLRGCTELRYMLEKCVSNFDNVSIIGPAPENITKMNNRYRYKLSVSCVNNKNIRNIIANVMRSFSLDKKNRGLSVFANTDPFD